MNYQIYYLDLILNKDGHLNILVMLKYLIQYPFGINFV